MAGVELLCCSFLLGETTVSEDIVIYRRVDL